MCDKFYTKQEIAQLCFDQVKPFIKNSDVIIEPSAGDGSFMRCFGGLSAQCIDIAPDHPDITQGDFLTMECPKDSVCIGNPPFGRQSSLAKKFIRHACSFARLVAFVLPKSFKKESMFSCFDDHFHCVLQMDLPKDSFYIPGGEPYDVPCVFQIWEKRAERREVRERLEPNGWSFVKKDQNPTCAFRRVGANAGTISFFIDDKSPQSHYFLNIPHESLQILQNHTWEFENTVGPRSISKQEIIRVLQ